MISYAQNCEDVLLERLFADVACGFYIDVGAIDARDPSITRHFYGRGWRGVNVAFLPRAYYRLQQDRPRDVNLWVGVAAASGEQTVFVSPDDAATSGKDSRREPQGPQRETGLVERCIPVWTLREIVERYVAKPVTFLVLHTPGRESDILAAAELSRWRPRVVVVQGDPLWPDPSSSSSSSSANGERQLEAAGYRLGCFDGVNQLWVRKEDADLIDRLRLPVSSRDGFVSGSLLRAARLAALRGKTLQDCEAAVAAKESVILELTAALHERDNALQQMGRVLSQQDAALRKLDESLRERDTSLKEKDRALHAALVQAELLQDQLRNKEAALFSTLAEGKTLARQLTEKESALWEQIEQNRRLQAQLQDKHAALENLQAQAERLRQALEEKEAALASKHAALIEALAACQQLNAELRAKEQALQTVCRQAQDLQQQLVDKHAALHQALGWAEEYRQRLLGNHRPNAPPPPGDLADPSSDSTPQAPPQPEAQAA